MESMSVVKKCVDGYDKQGSYFGNDQAGNTNHLKFMKQACKLNDVVQLTGCYVM